MLKALGLLVVGVVLGMYLGAWSMREQISQKFAQGEGRAICEAVLKESP